MKVTYALLYLAQQILLLCLPNLPGLRGCRVKVSCEVNLDLNCVHCVLLCSPRHLSSQFYFEMLFTFSF